MKNWDQILHFEDYTVLLLQSDKPRHIWLQLDEKLQLIRVCGSAELKETSQPLHFSGHLQIVGIAEDVYIRDGKLLPFPILIVNKI